jgi:hypothetical protein
MKNLATSVLALFGLALFSIAGCTPSPQAQCKESLKVVCEKVHECTQDKTTDSDNDGTPDFEEMFGASVSECVTMMNDGYSYDLGGFQQTVPGAKCENVTKDNACDNDSSGSTYDPAAAADCLDATRTMTCDTYNDPNGQAPAVCDKVCT